MESWRLVAFCMVTMLTRQTEGACVFPSHLTGLFDESLKGQLTFTTDRLLSYSLHTFGDIEFECFDQYNTSQYILKSTSFITYFGQRWEAYMCWDLTEISSDKFLLNEGSTSLVDAGGEHVKIYFQGATPVSSEICAVSSFDTGAYRFLMRKDTISSSKVACPYQLENFWTYTIDTGSGDSCAANDTMFDVCSDSSTMTFNSSLCSTEVMYSSGGVVNCLYNLTSGSLTYLTTYNADTIVDGSTTFRYTCMVLDFSSSSTVYATQYPVQCLGGQNATVASSPGAKLVFTYNTTCVQPTTTAVTTAAVTTASTTTPAPVAAAASLDWVAGVVIAIFLIIALVVGVLLFFFWKYRKALKEKERELLDRRAEDENMRSTDEYVEERGQAPPSVKFTFPDYTRRILEKVVKKKHGDRDRLVRRDYNDRPLSPSGISFRDSESPDSAIGLDEDDGYQALRSQRSRPVSDFMKKLINLHEEQREREKERAKVPEEKRFMKVHGRSGFKDESALKDAAGMNLVSKIKKMARKRRKRSTPYENQLTDRHAEEINQNEANEEAEVMDDEQSTTSEEPTQLDVSQLLAYTALPPGTPELPRGDDRRQRAVTIAPPDVVSSNAVIIEDLDAPTNSANRIVVSPERARDQSKVFTIGSREVTPNLKMRREPPVIDRLRNDSFLARIHRKQPVKQVVPDIETARVSSGRMRRSANGDNWGRYLEEMYPDKLYFEFAKGSSSRTENHLRHSADDGLDYLYDRAMYWKDSQKLQRPASRAKSSKSTRRKVRSVNSARSVGRSRSVNESKLHGDTGF